MQKLLQLYLVIQGRALLEHINPIVKVGAHFKPWRILKETTEPVAHLKLCRGNPDTLEMVLNQIVYSNSTAGKCAHMQVVKQPERAYDALSFGKYGRLK